MAASAADKVQDADGRLGKTLQGLSQVNNSIENLIRYVNHPRVTVKRARELMIEAIGMLGASKQGEDLALRTYKVNERLEEITQQLRNIQDAIEDLQIDVTELKDRAGRWEGDLRR